MRAVIQRVTSSKVVVDQVTVGSIDKGFLVLLGVGQGDDVEKAAYLADRIAGLRVFADAEGKMNLSVSQIGGSVLVVSQFTLYADCYRGRRPGFTNAAEPVIAKHLYESFCDELRRRNIPVQTGVFQADMQVHLVNDGPVTIFLDTNDVSSYRVSQA
ncbi:MAG: D-aminoacyl-tRNA deacylase [Pirellulaceae bacterium]|nr:D-aminoacyl-tRNA deacylase [Pirellulaceae bacterium]